MSWGVGQLHASNEAIRMNLAGIRAGLAHLETSTHADVAALKTMLDERVSDLREKLATTEASLRHDVGSLRTNVFERVDRRFDAMDQRFDGVDQRLEGLDVKLDRLLAAAESGQGGKQ